MSEVGRHKNEFLRSNGAVFAAGGTSAALGFLVLVVLSRNLDPAAFGVVSTIVNVLDAGQIAIDALLMGGMVHVAARHMKRDPSRAEMAFKIAFWLRVAVALVIGGVGFLTAPYIAESLFAESRWVAELRVAFVAILGAAVYTFGTSVLQARQHFGRLSLVTLYKNTLRLLAVGLLVVVHGLSVRTAVWAICGAMICAALLAFFTLQRRFLREQGFRADVTREMLSINKWMVLAAVGLLGARVDIAMLSGMAGPDQVGLYAVALQLCMVITVFSQSLVTTIFPKAAAFTNHDEMWSHIVRCARYMPLVLVPLVVLRATSDWFVPLIFGVAYADTAGVFNWLMISALITLACNPVMLLLFPLGRVAFYGIIGAVQLGLRIVLNLTLIPSYGAEGAGLSDLLVKIVTTVLMVGVVLWSVLRMRASGRDDHLRDDAP